MDSDQLLWLHRNPECVEAVERNLRESTELSELLERMSWLPQTLEEKETLESQTAKWKAARAVVNELRETLLAGCRSNGRGRKGGR